MTRWRIAAAAAVIAVAAIVAIDATAPAGWPDRYHPFGRAPYVDFLERHAGHHRVIATDGVLTPNFASALEIQDLRYVAALAVASMQRYRVHHLHVYPLSETSGDVLWFTGGPFLTVRIPRAGRASADDRIGRPLGDDFRLRLPRYSFLGVKYVVVPKTGDLNADPGADGLRFPLVYDADVRIYENPAVLPRAFLARTVHRAQSFEEAQQMASSPGFDPRADVVLEQPAPPDHTVAGGPASAERATITRYEPNRVVVETHATAASALVLTDVYYPGWKATVDGRPSEVYRANGLVRAVFVPAGRHVVEFRYLPASFTAGLAAAGGGLAICLGLLVAAPRRAGLPALAVERADA